MITPLLKYSAAVVCLVGSIGLAIDNDPINFNRDIRPILSNKCFQCHGPDEEERAEDLRLDIPDGEQGALTPREDYRIIQPGDLEGSELWWRINSEYEDEQMPPRDSHKEPLSEREIELFRQWIEEGGDYQAFWAFVAPEKSAPAKIDHGNWGANPIDGRVLAQLEKKGLQPASEADKRTLIRRATFDLTGLPPTLQEIDDFLSDKSPEAYEKLVDRLLAQESYGEHMARYWADLVRLSDTNGMHKDFHREFSSYRDWLIRSFNENLPFDDFVKFQLAGDLYEEPSRDQLVASGFNRLHLIIDKGTALPEESLHKNVLDRVEAFGTAFLGLTVQCAQCHDHKYDPITQKDYYQLYAFFNSFSGAAETVRDPERGLQPPFINLSTPKQEQALAQFDGREQVLNMKLEAFKRRLSLSSKWPSKYEKVSVPWIWNDPKLDSKQVEFKATLNLDGKPDAAMARFVGMSEFEVWLNGELLGKSRSLENGIAAELSELLKSGKNVITAKASRANGKMGMAFLLEYTIDGEARTFASGPNWLAKANGAHSWQAAVEVYEPSRDNGWTEKVRAREIYELEGALARLVKERRAFLDSVPAAMIMSEMDPPRPATMLIRGAYDAPGESVERNTPAFLPPLKEKTGPYSRLDLAEWIVAPNHPLTSRVAVNRFWQQFFGVGLVKTSEDFGAQGEWPSHPELLDDLAVGFMESGWDVKKLIRGIVVSKTYMQSSDAAAGLYVEDPANRLLARGSRYRMDAEMIRDQILAVSGQLNRTLYGKSVKPPQPPGLWEMVSMAEPKTYIADTDDNIYRRSFYTYWRRGMPPPQMTIMNAPSREFCVTRRERTNTPLQALLLMNEQEYFKAAKVTAKRTLKETDDAKAGLSLTYERITSHKPEAGRLELMEETLGEFIDIYRNDPALTESLTPELAQSGFDERVKVAAWTMITHSLFNLELAKVRR